MRSVAPLAVSVVLAFASLAPARTALAEPALLGDARRAMQEVRYAEARTALDALFAQGGLERAELVDALTLAGQVAAILDGPEAGEREFRRLLVLAPDHRLPRSTPVFALPFERASRWVQTAGALAVDALPPPATATPETMTPIVVRVASDPLAMVAGARLLHRLRGDAQYGVVTGQGLAPKLPATPDGAVLEYVIEVVDAKDDVLARLGARDRPLVLPVGAAALALVAPPPASPPEERSPPRSARRLALGLVGAALTAALAATGAGLDAASVDEFHAVERRCGPGCPGSALGTLHGEEAGAVVGYSLAGVVAVATVVYLVATRGGE